MLFLPTHERLSEDLIFSLPCGRFLGCPYKASRYFADITDMNSTRSPSPRQRVHVTFALRLRLAGASHDWQSATGIDISTDGLACIAPLLAPPPVGTVYEMEVLVPPPEQTLFSFKAEVRWSLPVEGGKKLGLQVADPRSRATLARALRALATRQSSEHGPIATAVTIDKDQSRIT